MGMGVAGEDLEVLEERYVGQGQTPVSYAFARFNIDQPKSCDNRAMGEE